MMTTNDDFLLVDLPCGFDQIPSPALVLDRTTLEANIESMLRVAGAPSRLWPHIKTHKTREIVRMLLERGVSKFKCATLREARLLAEQGVERIMVAYPLVGPNVGLFVSLVELFPGTRLAAVVDAEEAVHELLTVVSHGGVPVDVFLDLDVGMHRTGIAPGDAAEGLCRRIAVEPHLRFAGLHAYDGHNHQASVDERRRAAAGCYQDTMAFVRRLRSVGVETPDVVIGGTPTFPMYAPYADVGLSPGTAVIHDWGYAESYPDLPFEPAAFVLGRVISRPSSELITLDIGCKAIASDPPGPRGHILEMPDAEPVSQNEEHWVFRRGSTEPATVGSIVRVIPTHVCPTFNLYDHVLVSNASGVVHERWEIAARGR